MVAVIQLTDKLRSYIATQLDSMSKTTPMVGFMMENLMTTQPFIFKTSFIGDIEIGGGSIKLNIPLTDKRLVFDMTDLENFKEMLITKD